MFEILWFEMGWDIPSEGFCPSPAHPPHLKFVKTLWNMYAHWLRPVWLMHYVWLALLTLAIVPWTHTENNLFSNCELCDAGTWLCPIWCIQMGEYSSKKILSFPYQQIKTVGLFIPGNITILQLFFGNIWHVTPSNKRKKMQHVHALHAACSTHSFYIVLWIIFQPWTLYQPWTPWHMLFSSVPCCLLCWRSLFFYCTQG